jgi:hypothetical protein
MKYIFAKKNINWQLKNKILQELCVCFRNMQWLPVETKYSPITLVAIFWISSVPERISYHFKQQFHPMVAAITVYSYVLNSSLQSFSILCTQIHALT